ncbi:MAG: hypothetical protein JSV08_07930 [Acidobacteriota bacterium]|nr:MAG: hypothetical protein JSV08_07930 [Acidobacteriota bacterium]
MTVRDFAVVEYKQHLETVRRTLEHLSPLPRKGRSACIARARTDALHFKRIYLPHYFDCEFAPFHRKLQGEIERESRALLLVAGSRDHGKSSFVTIGDTVRRVVLGKTRLAVIGSGTLDRALQFLRAVRMELESNPRIRQDFGDHVGKANWGDKEFNTYRGVRVLALGRKGQWRGLLHVRRPDWVVIDDLERRDNVGNKRIVDERIRWLQSDVYGAYRGKCVVLGNLFSRRCALARLFDNSDEEYVFDKFRFDALDACGAPTWPERFTREELDEKRRVMGSALFEAEFMNRPADEDALVKEEWIKWVAPDEVPSLQALRVFGFLDPSVTAREASDFKAFVTVGFAPDATRYVLDSWIRRASPEAAMDAVYEGFKKFRHERIGMEQNMLHDFLRESVRAAELRWGFAVPWQSVVHREAKEIRVSRIVPSLERGEWRFVKEVGNNALLAEQLLFYGAPGTHDDGPDALAGCEEMRARVNRYRIEWTKW